MAAPDCPNCGGALVAKALPFTPPWKCDACFLGWYTAQVAESVVGGWRSRYQDFGGLTMAQRVALREAIAAEVG